MPTTKEMMKHFKFICDKVNLEAEAQKILFDKFFEFADHPVVNRVIDFIGNLKEPLKEFDEQLAVIPAAKEALEKQVRPLIVFVPEIFDYVRVYTNILIEPGNYSNLQQITAFDARKCLGSFLAAYNIDMKGPGAEKWSTAERVDKRIGAYTDMTIARALTLYANPDKQFKDDTIRDMAVKLETSRKPAELMFADRPEDFRVMYGSGPPSCMSHNIHSWPALEKHKLTPTSFYAYFPWSRGAYLMKKGRVSARVVLYTDHTGTPKDLEMGFPNFNKSLGKVWRYGYIYAATPEDNKELVKALKAKNIKSLTEHTLTKGNHFIPPEKYPFIVPGFEEGCGTHVIPFPYFDNMDYKGTGFSASFDSTTKNFTLTYKAGEGSVPANNRSGYLISLDYIQKKCDYCNATKGDWTTTNDGRMYCGSACARRAGYSEVFQGNGSVYIKVTDKSQYIEAEDGKLFTNRKAAAPYGYYLPMVEAGIFGEETELLFPVRGSKYGTVVTRPQDKAGEVYNSIFDGRQSGMLIPVIIESEQRTVIFNAEEPLAAA